MTVLYGIPNCDQVKKARAWLTARSIAHEFHDFKKAGISAAIIDTWLQNVSSELLVNRKGTTWRALSEERKASITDARQAVQLMMESPSVIKRPVLHVAGRTHVGFDAVLYQQLFEQN
jgi:arsenate reductase